MNFRTSGIRCVQMDLPLGSPLTLVVANDAAGGKNLDPTRLEAGHGGEVGSEQRAGRTGAFKYADI